MAGHGRDRLNPATVYESVDKGSPGMSRVIVLILGFVGGAAVTYLLLPHSGGTDTQLASESRGIERVAAELASLRPLLEQLVGRPAVMMSDGESAAPQPLRSAGEEELSAALHDLASSINALTASGHTGSIPDAVAVNAPAPSLATLASSMIGNYQVVPELFGLGPSAVLQRYGPPASVESSEGKTSWYYYLNSEVGRATGNMIRLRFVDNYLADVAHY